MAAGLVLTLKERRAATLFALAAGLLEIAGMAFTAWRVHASGSLEFTKYLRADSLTVFFLINIGAVFFLGFTLLMSFWLGPTLQFALAGMAIGAVLGLLGLALTRWKVERQQLFYTPSRWLALIITFAITARIAYGWWHATHPRNGAPDQQHWLMTASATQFSLAVAGGLIGYYLIYAIGVRLRLRRHERSRSA